VGSVDDCAARLVELLLDHELRTKMGRAARARVAEHFLTIRELEDLIGLFARLS
jgi:glycosyltransferase involved in cell wall biosynthesis